MLISFFLMAGSPVSAVTDHDISEVLCTSLVGTLSVLLSSIFVFSLSVLVSSCRPGDLAVVLGVSSMPSISCVGALR